MMGESEQIKQTWSVWIDEKNKVISTKKTTTGKEMIFESRQIGMQRVIDLAACGYKIG